MGWTRCCWPARLTGPPSPPGPRPPVLPRAPRAASWSRSAAWPRPGLPWPPGLTVWWPVAASRAAGSARRPPWSCYAGWSTPSTSQCGRPGGIGRHTAAGAVAAGARGVVLDAQLALCRRVDPAGRGAGGPAGPWTAARRQSSGTTGSTSGPTSRRRAGRRRERGRRARARRARPLRGRRPAHPAAAGRPGRRLRGRLLPPAGPPWAAAVEGLRRAIAAHLRARPCPRPAGPRLAAGRRPRAALPDRPGADDPGLGPGRVRRRGGGGRGAALPGPGRHAAATRPGPCWRPRPRCWATAPGAWGSWGSCPPRSATSS